MINYATWPSHCIFSPNTEYQLFEQQSVKMLHSGKQICDSRCINQTVSFVQMNASRMAAAASFE